MEVDPWVQAELAQPLGFFIPTLHYQQPGQRPGGVLVASVSPRPRSVQAAMLNQQVGQPEGGIPVAGVSPPSSPSRSASLASNSVNRTAACSSPASATTLVES
jgi:hypothetical protein